MSNQESTLPSSVASGSTYPGAQRHTWRNKYTKIRENLFLEIAPYGPKNRCGNGCRIFSVLLVGA